jgi:hypothetical protein
MMDANKNTKKYENKKPDKTIAFEHSFDLSAGFSESVLASSMCHIDDASSTHSSFSFSSRSSSPFTPSMPSYLDSEYSDIRRRYYPGYDFSSSAPHSPTREYCVPRVVRPMAQLPALFSFPDGTQVRHEISSDIYNISEREADSDCPDLVLSPYARPTAPSPPSSFVSNGTQVRHQLSSDRYDISDSEADSFCPDFVSSPYLRPTEHYPHSSPASNGTQVRHQISSDRYSFSPREADSFGPDFVSSPYARPTAPSPYPYSSSGGTQVRHRIPSDIYDVYDKKADSFGPDFVSSPFTLPTTPSSYSRSAAPSPHVSPVPNGAQVQYQIPIHIYEISEREADSFRLDFVPSPYTRPTAPSPSPCTSPIGTQVRHEISSSIYDISSRKAGSSYHGSVPCLRTRPITPSRPSCSSSNGRRVRRRYYRNASDDSPESPFLRPTAPSPPSRFSGITEPQSLVPDDIYDLYLDSPTAGPDGTPGFSFIDSQAQFLPRNRPRLAAQQSRFPSGSMVFGLGIEDLTDPFVDTPSPVFASRVPGKSTTGTVLRRRHHDHQQPVMFDETSSSFSPDCVGSGIFIQRQQSPMVDDVSSSLVPESCVSGTVIHHEQIAADNEGSA